MDKFLERFSVIKVLEEKHGTLVQLCQQRIDLELVVAKIYTKSHMRMKDIVRLQHEGTVMTMLKGVPGQVQLRHYVEDKEYFYLVMDYYERGDLLHFKHNYLVSTELSLVICKKLAHALHVFHQHGYAHRDIKLENVFLDKHFTPYLGDFGYSCVNKITKTPESLGSPAYVAPEVILGSNQVDVDLQKTDLFSLGVLFYSFMCGRHPYPGNSKRQMIRRDTYIPITIDDNIPRGMVNLIEGLLTINPNDRITWDSILLEKNFLPDSFFVFLK